ncbi:MAG TPA: response regulator [Vicinamibacterales bacterium]|nr:response regulator [Vicinamibacterales bacterium]
MRAHVIRFLTVFDLVVLFYFLAINTIYLVFSIVAYFQLRAHRRRWTPRALGAVMRSPATPGISIVAPAYNEEATVAESVKSLLMINYPQFEVVLVNDGSKDGTRDAAVAAFELVRAPASYEQPLPSKPVNGVYRSLGGRELVLIDKENGGKADAINAGINAARYPLVCVIDADSILEEHALSRAVLPFIEDPTTIASGGIIRIINSCTVDQGRVTDVRLPKNRVAIFQVVEYLRAFLAGRVAQSAANALLIVSGAFGIFLRKAVVDAGGFRHDTIGEDMELIVRLHRIYRDRGEPYRITFQPDPVCWTEAPESLKVLERQRNRWQRGTLQVLTFHWRMLFNPKYGTVGMLAMPYYLIFEALGPIVELTGYVVTILAVSFGLLDVVFAQLLFLAAVVYGTLISLSAVLLEELSYRRYPRVRDLLKLVAYGVLENFGYRQLTTWWRFMGIIDFLRGRQSWGTMTRKGFAKSLSLHVLLAEDDPDIRLVARLALKKAGYRVTVASNGREAIEKVAEDRPDVILLDWMMPDVDGPETCARLKADPATADIPVVFMTAKSQGFEVERGLSLGAKAYIVKPFDALTLGEQLKQILDRK